MDSLRTREIFNNTAVRVLVVESVNYRHNKSSSCCQLYGNIEPTAIIVCSQEEIYALDMQAKPVAMDLVGVRPHFLASVKQLVS